MAHEKAPENTLNSSYPADDRPRRPWSEPTVEVIKVEAGILGRPGSERIGTQYYGGYTPQS